jgi:ABC-type Zn uptake system ZnuABC Zn-binding protein ZnuA
MRVKTSIFLITQFLAFGWHLEATVNVVTTLPAYASIARYIGGDRVTVEAISRGDEDAHFVRPKPSFAILLRRADLFVTTGLDLEIWAPILVDKSGNRNIRDGQSGFVSASQGVTLLDVPSSADRSGGDVHVYGNPHIFTSPLNAKIIGTNIAGGLARVDPGGAGDYQTGLARFHEEIDQRLYGSDLIGLLGGETLNSLTAAGTLYSFLAEQKYEGRPLIERLGGWMGQARSINGSQIVCYHKNWIYLTDLLGLKVIDYVEPKPGIPPSARHVHDLIEVIKTEKIPLILAANYFSAQQVDMIAERTGSTAVQVPLGPGGSGPQNYFELVDFWLDRLTRAIQP